MSTDKEKKIRRNKSQVEQNILSDLQEGEKSTLRYSIICCDLSTALKDFTYKNKFMYMFDTESKTQGIYRKLTGCLANYVLIHRLSNGIEIPEINKTFYDRCWSALDAKKRGDTPTHFGSELNEMIKNTKLNMDDVPLPVAFEMRQPTTRDMETSAINHIVINFEKRLSSFILYKLSNLPSADGVESVTLKAIVRKIITRLMKGATEIEPEFSVCDTGILIDEINESIHETSSILSTIIPTDPKKSVETALKKNAHILLKLLFTISTTFGILKEERKKLSDTVPTDAKRGTLSQLYKKQRLLFPGKEFSALPDWKLQPVFLDFALTQLETFFGKTIGNLEVFQNNIFKLQKITKLKKEEWYFMGFRTNGIELHVRLGALKSRKPCTTNTCALKDAGYKFPKPKKLVDVTQHNRGVYRITEKRYDNKKIKKNQNDDIIAHLTDPGVVSVVTVREVKISDCSSSENVEYNSETWSYDESSYKKDIMQSYSRMFEIRRRCKKAKRKYGNIIKELGKTTKKTMDLDKYTDYLSLFFQNIKPLKRELSSRTRRVIRYQTKKAIQKTLDKLADRLTARNDDNKKHVLFFGDGSFNAKRGHVAVPRKSLVKACSDRMLTFVLNEFGTSKYCPNCGSEMEDVIGCRRIRRCSSDPNGDKPCIYTRRFLDRDDSATISMALCAAKALQSHSRPLQYCRADAEQANYGLFE